MRRALPILVLLALSPLLAACGNTIQSQPMSDTYLEQLVAFERFPVYWVGPSFHGLQLTSVTEDPGGAYTLQYGDCTVVSASNCLTPLEIVSSPDNSFLPSAEVEAKPTRVRGVDALQRQGGRVLEMLTGPIAIDLRARSAYLARAAAQQMAPINELGQPAAALPAALPSTGYDRRVMEAQRPWTVKLLPPVPSSAPRG